MYIEHSTLCTKMECMKLKSSITEGGGVTDVAVCVCVGGGGQGTNSSLLLPLHAALQLLTHVPLAALHGSQGIP